jgi:hypothetical protein
MSNKPLLLILFLSFAFCYLDAQNHFTVKDELVSSADAGILDPEYNVAHNLVCWQSDFGELWVCRLDLTDHHFVPHDGKGTLVDVDLTQPIPGGWNGPEWMLSQNNTQIVYNQKKGSTRYPGIATQVLGGWSTETLMQFPGTLYSMATRNYNDSVSMFLFESDDEIGISWVKNNDLNTCYFYPEVTLGFFALDEPQICCAIGHSRQPGYLETQSNIPYFNLISQDTIGAPFMWTDPESGTRMFMYRTNNHTKIKILQENQNGNWYQYHSFTSPLPEPYKYLTSPEPFIFGGKSYVSFMAAQSPLGMDELPAQIWIASINPMDSLMRRISDSTYGIRLDPEPVVFDDSAFVYYTEKIHTSKWQYLHRVRKCDTGLELLNTGKSNPYGSQPGLTLYPNPAKDIVNLSLPSFGKQENILGEILDFSGRLRHIFSPASNPYSLQLPDLPDGMYLVRVISKDKNYNGKLQIRR